MFNCKNSQHYIKWNLQKTDTTHGNLDQSTHTMPLYWVYSTSLASELLEDKSSLLQLSVPSSEPGESSWDLVVLARCFFSTPAYSFWKNGRLTSIGFFGLVAGDWLSPDRLRFDWQRVCVAQLQQKKWSDATFSLIWPTKFSQMLLHKFQTLLRFVPTTQRFLLRNCYHNEISVLFILSRHTLTKIVLTHRKRSSVGQMQNRSHKKVS